MLTEKTTTALPGAMTTSIVLVASILAGGGLGHVAPALGQALGNLPDHPAVFWCSLWRAGTGGQ